ncbi:hypothetical protein ED733_002096 [Metarhizium rileyi]|uniref:Uncharacterized protein n=1 Tax=Metarhizium rileyi (strain RCEF 4871) TaxID=1649241 RepID=A0A5C6G668_METRR|nr:hypothetical protein ED733_002096 [Metarhizium rileyi]
MSQSDKAYRSIPGPGLPINISQHLMPTDRISEASTYLLTLSPAALPVETIKFEHITCTLQRQGPGVCDARTCAQSRDLHQDTWFDWETGAGSRKLSATLLVASGPWLRAASPKSPPTDQ